MLYCNSQSRIVVPSNRMKRPTFYYDPDHWIFLHIVLWRVSFANIGVVLHCNSSGPLTAGFSVSTIALRDGRGIQQKTFFLSAYTAFQFRFLPYRNISVTCPFAHVVN